MHRLFKEEDVDLIGSLGVLVGTGFVYFGQYLGLSPWVIVGSAGTGVMYRAYRWSRHG